MLSYSEEPRVLDNKDYLSYAAAASVILGAKLNDTKSLLTMVSVTTWLHFWLLSILTLCFILIFSVQSKFSHFDVDRLVQFEQHVLFKTSCQVSPLCTPSNFLHYMMGLSSNIPNKSKLLYNANLLIAEFLAGLSFYLFVEWIEHRHWRSLNFLFRSRVRSVRALHDRFDRSTGVFLLIEDSLHGVAGLHSDVLFYQCWKSFLRMFPRNPRGRTAC